VISKLKYDSKVQLTRVNQLSAVLNSNLDDLVAGEISSDRGVLASLANDVGFVGL
jgi:hypothetical protein